MAPKPKRAAFGPPTPHVAGSGSAAETRVTIPQPPPLSLTPRRDKALVTIGVGAEALAMLKHTRPAMQAYATRCDADFVELAWPGHPQWPMSAKFALPRVLDHYPRIAYVDADVLLRPGCIDLFQSCQPHEMGVVDELPHRSPAQQRQYQQFRAALNLRDVRHPPWYFNAGVMVVPRSHQRLLLPPAKPMPVYHCAEQDHTNAQLLDSGLPYRLLDRRCNWQNWTDEGFQRAPPDAILHFSGGGPGRDRRPELIAEQALPWHPPIPEAQITTRNLLYHACPLQANDDWRSCIAELLEYGRQIFNGRRLVAIATGKGLHDPGEVRSAFASLPGVEFLEIPNDRELREVASFGRLLAAVQSTHADEATFYAHTKGNSTACNVTGARLWRSAMHRELLGNWQACLAELRRHAFVGTHKMIWPKTAVPPFPSRLKVGNWMHAGTFFWFRHDQVFSNRNWQAIPADRYGAEAWPSVVCPDHTAAKSMFQPWPEVPYVTPDPYDPRLYAAPQ